MSRDDSDVAFAYSHYELHDKRVIAEIPTRNKRRIRTGTITDVRGSRVLIRLIGGSQWILKSAVIAIIEDE